ncbi:hypothetical protein KWH79_22495, partial [Enterobacter bugandensis]|uniref:hypothetical protein n=1 Tax=Enterobacter bugandensis TaxID=881260 RepID=UPI0021D20D60
YDSGPAGGKVFHNTNNTNAGTINITSFLTLGSNGYIGSTEGGEQFIKGHTAALSTFGEGASVNTAVGVIHVVGAGTYGMTAQREILLKGGLISVDRMQGCEDKEGEPTEERALNTPKESEA